MKFYLNMELLPNEQYLSRCILYYSFYVCVKKNKRSFSNSLQYIHHTISIHLLSLLTLYMQKNNILFYLICSDAINSQKEKSREARGAFISNRLLPGVYFAFLTACGLLGGFGYALGRTKKRETTAKITQQTNATQLLDDGQRLAVRALRRASIYSLTGVFSLTCFLWLISGRPKTFTEFRQWTGSWLPSIKSKKAKEDEERTEFKSVTEFMQYLIDEDKKLKIKKKELSTNIKDI